MKAITSLITGCTTDMPVIAKDLPRVEVEVRDETLILTRKWTVGGIKRTRTTVIGRFADIGKLTTLMGLQRYGAEIHQIRLVKRSNWLYAYKKVKLSGSESRGQLREIMVQNVRQSLHEFAGKSAFS